MSTIEKKPVQNTQQDNSGQPRPRLLYTREEAAYMLSCSIRSLDYYIASKRITARRMGRKVLIQHGELMRFSRQDHTGDISQ
jgi:excisionase family DNA binding protein